MKKISAFIISMFLILLSTSAFADGQSDFNSVSSGTYHSFSPGLCSLHVEKDYGSLILTFVGNAEGEQCQIQGHTVRAVCRYGAHCTVEYSNRNRIEINILQDGNFLYRYGNWNADNATVSFASWSKFHR